MKGNQVYLQFGKELISFLGRASVHAFHENPNRIHTELTFLNPYSALSQNVCFCRPLKYLKPHCQTVRTQIRLLL